ncbi:MAG: hypothetical protein V3U02_11435 [Calditrichia bacterium]
MSFLVLGLPRSRTAWLANFLTYDGQFCYHEGVNGCNSIEEYKEKIKGKGDSNTGLMFFDFEKYFPDTKIIIIDSSIEDSVEFGKEVFNLDVSNEMLQGKNRLDNIKGLHIKLEDINENLKEIWEYVSNKPFDQDRADMLVKLDIKTLNPHDIDLNALNNFIGNFNASRTLQ